MHEPVNGSDPFRKEIREEVISVYSKGYKRNKKSLPPWVTALLVATSANLLASLIEHIVQWLLH